MFTWLLIAPVLIVLDLLWLGIAMKDFYRAKIGHLMSSTISWAPALLFYVLFAAGIWYFVVTKAGSWQQALLNGVLLGLLCYATYDLTNQATLKEWPVVITVIDIIWGGVVTGIAATAGFYISKLLG